MTDTTQGRLAGLRIAFLSANSGVEEVELTTPWRGVQDEGGTPVLIAPDEGSVQAFESDVNEAGTYDVDLTVADADVAEFAGLVLPGGTTNPDALRQDADAVALVRAFAEAGKPVAAICHGPWMLVEADLVRGRRLASWPSLQTDIRNAGGEWHDEQVVTDADGSWTLVTSRNPDDLDAFVPAVVDALAQYAAR